MEAFLVLLTFAVAAWMLLGPILLIVLWNRVRQVEEDVQRLRRPRLMKGDATDAIVAVTAPAYREAEPERATPAAEAVVWIDESSERTGALSPSTVPAPASHPHLSPAGVAHPTQPTTARPAEVFGKSEDLAQKSGAAEPPAFAPP